MTNVRFAIGGVPDCQHGVLPEPGNAPLAEPLQLIALALDDGEAARECFPDYRLTRLVVARLDLDDRDLMQLSDLVGDEVLRPVAGVPRPFNEHLRNVIAHYGLEALFGDDGYGLYHHAIRPTAYDFIRDEVIPSEMERWRAHYRGMSNERKMLAASIVWLYRAGKDNVWLRRVPCTWHAADAISSMNEAGVFRDWARLFGCIPAGSPHHPRLTPAYRRRACTCSMLALRHRARAWCLTGSESAIGSYQLNWKSQILEA